ncbi:hypothetical protein METP3_00857 [Methanosarcinales archaeon]|nr:hypothetical protein METP3_00857 [Methanosarcinales archaeon]
MSLNDIDALKKMYPEMFANNVTVTYIIGWIFVFILPFLIPYLYIRFFESRVVLFIRGKLIPFIKYRLHLGKLIIFVKRVLEYPIIRAPKVKM